MSPGGYLRGAAALQGPPEIARTQTYHKSVYIALTFLALLQVGCTLGLFLYIKEIQGQSTQKQFHIGNDITEVSNHPRSQNHQNWPVAHLTFLNSTEGSQGIEQLSSWNYKEGWAHLQSMDYHNGTLRVLQDGYYFVYANICFRRHKATMKISQNPLQLMLYVNKLNKNGRQTTLLKGGKTEVWANDSLYNFYSVYKGGVFKLVAGEGIIIKASNTALIDLSQEATYFGAFKLLDLYL
uniref:THD domain-containing protein n=1 Tax=Pyxicephalus adspersus TaxID=30357 RepID=A0AAV3B8S9_PYXAD|nr:TPA: hypothetical protein GDO54_000753 [Pyxicephalus adspersus]